MFIYKSSRNWLHWHRGGLTAWKKVQIRSFFWSLCSPNAGKYGPEKTSYLDTFQVVASYYWLHYWLTEELFPFSYRCILFHSSEVISFTLLCLNVMKPPFLQDIPCVTSNDAPQMHWNGIPSRGLLYLILMASQHSCFVNSYPSSLMGKFVNQFETPLWLKVSIILFVFHLILPGTVAIFLDFFFHVQLWFHL